MVDEKYIRVKYVKSSIGYSQKQKDTVAALGLRKLGQERVHRANDAILGMCRAVQHLVEWEEVDPSEVKS
ncbi:MAG: 50S ribosomal protein L30 [Chloroflexota bacterium]|nr:50S ribosomal protein L30 [Chloroflexota bacterium]